MIGLVAHYAAVCADTFSSELGILSRAQPRLITSLTLRRVPRGTNGGVTLLGLGAGVVGSIIMVSTALIFVSFCPGGSTSGKDAATAAAVTLSKAEGWAWAYAERATLIWFLAGCGTFGSLLDSFLGGWLQRSVRDARSGKIVEGDGGVRVLVLHDRKNLKRAVVTAAVAKVADGPQKAVPTTDASNTAVESGSSSPSSREGTPEKAGGSARSSRYDHKDKHRKPSFGDEKPTRVIESGIDVLDNNQVNFLMALMISVGSMAVAGWYWGIPLSSVLKA